MRRAVIFQACVVCAAVAVVYVIEGKQTRRAQDEARLEAAAAAAAVALSATSATGSGVGATGVHGVHHRAGARGTSVEVVEAPRDGGEAVGEVGAHAHAHARDHSYDVEKGIVAESRA